MVTSLLEEERIETTAAKAKELRRIVERLITSAKKNAISVVNTAESAEEKQIFSARRVAAVRQAAKVVRNRDALQILFGDYAERYKERPGGYTRIVRNGRRLGDNAEMAIIELIPSKAASLVEETPEVTPVEESPIESSPSPKEAPAVEV